MPCCRRKCASPSPALKQFGAQVVTAASKKSRNSSRGLIQGQCVDNKCVMTSGQGPSLCNSSNTKGEVECEQSGTARCINLKAICGVTCRLSSALAPSSLGSTLRKLHVFSNAAHGTKPLLECRLKCLIEPNLPLCCETFAAQRLARGPSVLQAPWVSELS